MALARYSAFGGLLSFILLKWYEETMPLYKPQAKGFVFRFGNRHGSLASGVVYELHHEVSWAWTRALDLARWNEDELMNSRGTLSAGCPGTWGQPSSVTPEAGQTGEGKQWLGADLRVLCDEAHLPESFLMVACSGLGEME